MPGRKALIYAAPVVLVLSVSISLWFAGSSDTDFRNRIGEAEKARRWNEASSLWHDFHADVPDRMTSADFVRWARCELVLDHPSKAQELLDRWERFEDRDPKGWELSVELRRALGDTDGVNRIVGKALGNAEARRSPSFLAVSTFGLLTVMDPKESGRRLQRWANAEPDSPLARVWLLQRNLEEIDATNQNGIEFLDQARTLAARWPDDPDIRRVLVEALFVQGEYDEIDRAMKRWPESDAKQSVAWARLEGRRLLEIEKNPVSAIPLFESVVARMPQDWRSRYRLSRSLAGAGRSDEARKEATRTVEIRELLEPAGLERVLKSAFPRGEPPNPPGLIELLRKIDQTELAQAWLEWYEAEKLISSLR